MGQVLIGAIELTGFITGINLEPFNAAFTAIGLSHSSIEHHLGGGPDVNTGAIAANKGNDRVGWHHRKAVHKFNCGAAAWGCDLFVDSHLGVSRKSYGLDEPSFACSAVIDAAELAQELVILRNFCSPY